MKLRGPGGGLDLTLTPHIIAADSGRLHLFDLQHVVPSTQRQLQCDGLCSGVTPALRQADRLGRVHFRKGPSGLGADNACKDTLDQLALKLQASPNGTLVIVGYVDSSETKSSTLAAQRAVNVEYYLATDVPNKLDRTDVQGHQCESPRRRTFTSCQKEICAPPRLILGRR
jgi:outer membrane protein OmpA-like peptidoglycan-associated protein